MAEFAAVIYAGERAREAALRAGALEAITCHLHVLYDPDSAEPFRFYTDYKDTTDTWDPGAGRMIYKNGPAAERSLWFGATRVHHRIGSRLAVLTIYIAGRRTDLDSVAAARSLAGNVLRDADAPLFVCH